MVNYDKWAALDDSDDEAVSAPATVAPAAAPDRYEELLERGNLVVNALLERNKNLSPELKKAYLEACVFYDGAAQSPDPSVRLRAYLNAATAGFKAGEFAMAQTKAAAAVALEPDNEKSKEILNACLRELGEAAGVHGDVAADAGGVALEAKDFLKAVKHFEASIAVYEKQQSTHPRLVHSLAHLALAQHELGKHADAAGAFSRAATAAPELKRKLQLRERSVLAHDRASSPHKACDEALQSCADALEPLERGEPADVVVLTRLALRAAKRCRALHRSSESFAVLQQTLRALDAAPGAAVEDVVAAVSDALADAAAAQGDFTVALAMARRAVEAYECTASDAASDADGRSAMRRRQAAACELSAAHAAMQLRDESASQHFAKAAQKFEALKDFKAAASALLRAAEMQAGPAADETYQDAARILAAYASASRADYDARRCDALLARALLGAHRPEDAVAPARRTLAVVAADSKAPARARFDAHETVAEALALSGKHKDAAEVLQRALAVVGDAEALRASWPHVDRDVAQLRCALAVSLEEVGERAAAAAEFKAAAKSYASLGDAQASKAAAARAAQADPASASDSATPPRGNASN
ncbi:hypothetical protein M885DRAFT_521747 [Pelagophyceae sp. CCMP2097]|nr:hypothetical protein M885DRAFT_521747 [Pelagophyceae sp. CCMP2097]